MAEVYVTGDNTPIAVVGTDGKVSLAISKNCCCKPVQCAIALVYTGTCEETCGSGSVEVSYRDDDGDHSVSISLPEPSDGSVSYVVVSTRGALYRFSVDSMTDLKFEVGSFNNTQAGDPYSIREKAGTDKCAYYAEIKPKYVVFDFDLRFYVSGFSGPLGDCLSDFINRGAAPLTLTASIMRPSGLPVTVELERSVDYESATLGYNGRLVACARDFISNTGTIEYDIPDSAVVSDASFQICDSTTMDVSLSKYNPPATVDCDATTVQGHVHEPLAYKVMSIVAANVCGEEAPVGEISMDPNNLPEGACEYHQYSKEHLYLMFIGARSRLPYINDYLSYAPISKYGGIAGFKYFRYNDSSGAWVECEPGEPSVCDNCGENVLVGVFEPTLSPMRRLFVVYGPCLRTWSRNGDELSELTPDPLLPSFYSLDLSVVVRYDGELVEIGSVEAVLDGWEDVWATGASGYPLLYMHAYYRGLSSYPICADGGLILKGAWEAVYPSSGQPTKGDYHDADYLLSNGMLDSKKARAVPVVVDGRIIGYDVSFGVKEDVVPDVGCLSSCPSSEAVPLEMRYYAYYDCTDHGHDYQHPLSGVSSVYPGAKPEVCSFYPCHECSSDHVLRGWIQFNGENKVAISKLLDYNEYGEICINYDRRPLRTILAVRMSAPYESPCGSFPGYFMADIYDKDGSSFEAAFSLYSGHDLDGLCGTERGCVWFVYRDAWMVLQDYQSYSIVPQDPDLFHYRSISTFSRESTASGQPVFVATTEWRCVDAVLNIAFEFTDAAWDYASGIDGGVGLLANIGLELEYDSDCGDATTDYTLEVENGGIVDYGPICLYVGSHEVNDEITIHSDAHLVSRSDGRPLDNLVIYEKHGYLAAIGPPADAQLVFSVKLAGEQTGSAVG